MITGEIAVGSNSPHTAESMKLVGRKKRRDHTLRYFAHNKIPIHQVLDQSTEANKGCYIAQRSLILHQKPQDKKYSTGW